MIKVSVVGAKGRMGSHVVDAVNGAQDMELALTLDAGDDLHAITPENTDVVVEFTVPSVTLDNVLTLIGQGVDVVVGTTGWTEDRLEQVRQALAAAPRADQAVFIAPNFAISAVLADYFAKLAAPYFPRPAPPSTRRRASPPHVRPPAWPPCRTIPKPTAAPAARWSTASMCMRCVCAA